LAPNGCCSLEKSANAPLSLVLPFNGCGSFETEAGKLNKINFAPDILALMKAAKSILVMPLKLWPSFSMAPHRTASLKRIEYSVNITQFEQRTKADVANIRVI